MKFKKSKTANEKAMQIVVGFAEFARKTVKMQTSSVVKRGVFSTNRTLKKVVKDTFLNAKHPINIIT